APGAPRREPVLHRPDRRLARDRALSGVHPSALHPRLRPRAARAGVPVPRGAFRPRRRRGLGPSRAAARDLRGFGARGRDLRPPVSTAPPRTGPGRDWVAWLERRLNLSEIFSFLSHFGLVYTPVDTSKPIHETLRDVAAERLPAHSGGPRMLGLVVAILFGLEAMTGVLLACWYRPTPEAAYSSTMTIARDLPFGWFIHQIHAWGAYLLIGVVTLRLLRLFWEGLYRAPREVLWWSAVAMAWTAVQADFTGRLLPWDARSYWSVVRGLEVVTAQPVVGPILTFLVGGRVVNEDVLIRFYALHLLVLPALFLVFLYLTIATLRRIGPSSMAASEPGTTTYRHHFISMLILSVLAFGVLVSLA